MLIDAHAHLDQYDAIAPILSEIQEHQILTISNSMNPDDYQRNLEIAKASELVIPTFGVHPWEAPEYAGRLDDFVDEIASSPMIGECGLDYFFVEDESKYSAQRKVFGYLLSAARNQKKVVTVHTKGAEEDVLEMLETEGVKRAIIHWYSGPLRLLERYLSLGCYFTIGVEVLKSDEIRRLARGLPLERLLTETDNPGGYRWLTGTAGTPRVISDVVKTLAEIRGLTSEEMVTLVGTNLKTLLASDLVGKHRLDTA